MKERLREYMCARTRSLTQSLIALTIVDVCVCVCASEHERECTRESERVSE